MSRIRNYPHRANQTRGGSRNVCPSLFSSAGPSDITNSPGLFRSPRPQGSTNSGAQGASAIYCTVYCTLLYCRWHDTRIYETHVSQESTYSPSMTSRTTASSLSPSYPYTHFVTRQINIFSATIPRINMNIGTSYDIIIPSKNLIKYSRGFNNVLWKMCTSRRKFEKSVFSTSRTWQYISAFLPFTGEWHHRLLPRITSLVIIWYLF